MRKLIVAGLAALSLLCIGAVFAMAIPAPDVPAIAMEATDILVSAGLLVAGMLFIAIASRLVINDPSRQQHYARDYWADGDGMLHEFEAPGTALFVDRDGRMRQYTAPA